MYCPTGVIDTKPMYYGLISSEIVNQVQCTPKVLADFIKTEYTDKKKTAPTDCTSQLKPNLQDMIKKTCDGKKDCSLDLSNKNIFDTKFFKYPTV